MILIQQYLAFLTKLKSNNNREWFDVHRVQYKDLQTQYVDWIGGILRQLVVVDDALMFLSPKECVFRINRDVRFSNDKSPYKTNISAVFSSSGKSESNAAYYFELGSDGRLMVGGGRYMLFPQDLLRIRQLISEDSTQLRTVLSNKQFQKTFGGLCGDQLKTRPKGFSSEDPNIDLLKFKNYIVMDNLSILNQSDEDIAAVIMQRFHIVKPFIQLLRSW